jgi:hypothetical protein
MKLYIILEFMYSVVNLLLCGNKCTFILFLYWTKVTWYMSNGARRINPLLKIGRTESSRDRTPSPSPPPRQLLSSI